MRKLITTLAFVLAGAGSALPAQPLIQNAVQIEGSGQILFRVPDHEPLTGLIRIQEQFEEGLRGWAGPLQGVPGSFAVLSHGGQLSARVHLRDRVFLFKPSGGAHRVTSPEPPPFSCAAQQGASQLGTGAVSAPVVAGACDHLTARSWDPCYAAEQAMAAATVGVNSCVRLPHASDPVDINLVVFYTPKVAAAHTWWEILHEVYFGILETRASFDLSRVPATLRMARRGRSRTPCLYRSSTDETGIMDDDLKALLTAMPDVVEKRNFCGADIVVLLTETSNKSGIACVMKSLTPAFAPYAMAIVRFSSLVHHYTFTHEIGHLMGGGHDRTQTETDNNCRTGMCPESAGWHFTHDGIEYKSMMAYGGVKSLYFSSPQIRFEGGPLTGTANANNAQTLRRTARTVSDFRP